MCRISHTYVKKGEITELHKCRIFTCSCENSTHACNDYKGMKFSLLHVFVLVCGSEY